MTARVISGYEMLSSGTFGIPEPSNKSDILMPWDIDMAVVPAVSYDYDGFRLGRGKGYYDRYLCHVKGIKVGLAREKTMVKSVPREEHDIPVDIVVSEDKIRYMVK